MINNNLEFYSKIDNFIFKIFEFILLFLLLKLKLKVEFKFEFNFDLRLFYLL